MLLVLRTSGCGTDRNQLNGWFFQENAALDTSMMDLADDLKIVTVVEVKDLISRTAVPLKVCSTKFGDVGTNFKKFRKVRCPYA
jgi:hypothetical protein